MNNELLRLDSVLYKNEFGQPYTISKLKYYVGNIQLKSTSGKYYTCNEYFLINEEDEISKSIELQNIPIGEYDEIRFLLGVDSLLNCSGAQSGALDPINGMFWSWNTGYIFLKLEGNSNSCKTPSNMFEYHIGGYKQPYNSIREMRLNLPNPILITGFSQSSIQINVAIDEILKNPNAIDFAETPTITDQSTSSTIADNYMDLFMVSAVSNEK
ncbi:MAG: hypothetical protein KA479_04770 [Saprospiraceae bacterium]|nr:hypothetical protein [Saprospiraceae bacterium]MBP7274452.1 hypothetical protein [Saprospiraceae bacterium]